MVKIIEYDDFNSGNKISISQARNPVHCSVFLSKIKKILKQYNYLLIKNFGTDTEQFKQLNHSISEQLYFSERIGSYLHSFKTELYSENLSECAKSGEFHTDFSFQENCPNYISLQCITPDPKYPFLGRNYVASVNTIVEVLVQQFHQNIETLLNLLLPYSFGDKVIWVNPFYQDNNEKIIMKIHLSLVDVSLLRAEHYINDIPITLIIAHIALDCSDDFVLNQGDVLILSNKYLLHKRGECSIGLQSSANEENQLYKSRQMNSMRFY